MTAAAAPARRPARRPPWPRLLAAGTLAGVLATTAGCTSGTAVSGPGTGGAPDDPIAAARQLDGVSGVVSEGDSSETCGEVRLDQGEPLPPEIGACLADRSAAGRPGEAAWTTPTTEGDPIVSFAVVGPDIDGVQIYSTSAFDAFGGSDSVRESWTVVQCADPGDVTMLGRCTELFEG